MSEEVADLELLAYNKRNQRIVRQVYRKRKSEIGENVACVTEEQVMDVRNATLADLVASALAITQATMDRVQQEENDAAILKLKIKRLEEQSEL
jgi:hypothetical protein